MAQVKKSHVRQAILDNAYRLFKKRGYVATTMAHITRAAGISESNLYVYFDSKFEVLLALYEPWLRERIHRLEGKVESEKDPRRRLRIILTALWRELPEDDNNFTNNLMQALSTVAAGDDGHRPDLLRWTESRIEALILTTLPKDRRDKFANPGLAHILMMAQDGLAMNFRLNPHGSSVDGLIDIACHLILGGSSSQD